MLGGCHAGVTVSSIVTPCGSPGCTSWSGPTVDGGTAAGSFGFGVISVGGGRIARVQRRAITVIKATTASRGYTPAYM
jgi:hypothetical protein